MKIDMERCYKAMANIHVFGTPKNADRLKLIEKAIVAIQENGETALNKEFLGIKNYASFGDQRCDCSYGHGPRHGSIVFSIGLSEGRRQNMRNGQDTEPLGEDEIYFLECVRDFGGIEDPRPGLQYNTKRPDMNLQAALEFLALYNKRMQPVIEKIFNTEIDIQGD